MGMNNGNEQTPEMNNGKRRKTDGFRRCSTSVMAVRPPRFFRAAPLERTPPARGAKPARAQPGMSPIGAGAAGGAFGFAALRLAAFFFAGLAFAPFAGAALTALV